jgi:glycosyltransferase involved in cell wall biosynthesis
MNPLLSIIIPVYNVERFVKQCHSSIVRQGFRDYEIVYVNDGSTDSSGVLCSEISSNNPNITVINKKNGGLSDARNVGINAARGEYIVLLDADDMLTDTALESLSEIIHSNNFPEVVVNRVKYISEDEKYTRECMYRFPEFFKDIGIADSYMKLIRLADYVPAAWTIVAKRKYLLENQLYFVKGLLHEDEQWTPRVILKTKSIAFNNNCIYLYRQGRVGSITQTVSIKREVDKMFIVESLYNESLSGDYEENSRHALIERAADLYWGVLVRSYQYRESYSDFSKLIAELRTHYIVLKLSNETKYKFISILIRIIGVRTSSFLLGNKTLVKLKKLSLRL